jgi:DNA-binding NarL/FixJ family response regulator
MVTRLSVPSSEEAKTLLGQARYAVVIADLRSTGSHGAEGLERVEYIRQRRPSTRIILLTVYGWPDIESEARRRGADAILHKRPSLFEIARVVAELPGIEA